MYVNTCVFLAGRFHEFAPVWQKVSVHELFTFMLTCMSGCEKWLLCQNQDTNHRYDHVAVQSCATPAGFRMTLLLRSAAMARTIMDRTRLLQKLVVFRSASVLRESC